VSGQKFQSKTQLIRKGCQVNIVGSAGVASLIEDLDNILIGAEDGCPVYRRQLTEITIRRGVQTRDGIEGAVSGMVEKLFGPILPR
jgi:Cu/Ag efflux pump CusA